MSPYLRWLSGWLCLLLVAAVRAGEPGVTLVSGEWSPSYVQLADALAAELERTGVPRTEVRRITVAELASDEHALPKLYVALGVQAASALARVNESTPVLCTLLPRASLERIVTESGRKISGHFSAIVLDQPWSRQLELIRQILPKARRVGVVWGDTSWPEHAALEAAATARGLRLVSARADSPATLFPALKRVLDEADVLLALADPLIYHSGSIQNILLSAVRARIPLVAFSPGYVKAGAIAAIHVTPAQIGLQAAALARAVLQGRPLPSTLQYSKEFEVAINLPVAHALELPVDPSALATRLRLLERAP